MSAPEIVPGLATVEIRAGSEPGDIVILVNGERLDRVVALSMHADAETGMPLQLSFRRIAEPVRAENGEIATELVEYSAEQLGRVDIAGVAAVVEDEARKSLTREQQTGLALHSFLIQDDAGRTATLAELVRDAERYRALRSDVSSGRSVLEITTYPRGKQAQSFLAINGTHVDKMADTVIASNAAESSNEPRNPT